MRGLSGGRMYLKEIEIFGFKSFPERTRLVFEDRVNCIVGPNGCGKSNIVDAIKWVLGEQSTSALRADRMEELIFNGSRTRKPINIAEVSLTLAREGVREGYGHITVTRRVSRSGQSEYFINKVPCRLKDIVELFMDTGVGRGGYFVIEQGRVERILDGKPEERRVLLEEAAGINKYKWKREEAERKLRQTEQNLLRLGDIMDEVERSLRSLQRQVARARRYLRIKEEIKELELKLGAYQHRELNEELGQISEGVGDIRSHLDAVRNERRDTDDRLNALREELEHLEAKMNSFREELSSIEQTRISKEGELEVLLQKASNIEEMKARAKEELERLLGQKENISQRLEHLEDELEKVRQDRILKLEVIGRLESELATLKQAIGDGEEEANSLREDIFQCAREEAELRNTLYEKRAASSNAEGALRQLEDLRARIAEELSSLKLRRRQLQEQLEEVEGRKGELEEIIGRKDKELGEVRQMLLDRERRLEKIEDEIESAEKELRLLSQMEERLEGYTGGARAVLLAKEHLRGIHGAVAQLFSFPPELATALETALGARAQFIVVEDAEAAREAVEYLKQGHGRAGFLPLDLVKGWARKVQGVLMKEGIIGIASQLIECQERYRSIFDYLLGNVVIVRDLNCAIALAREKTGFRIVTLEGEIIEPGGLIIGGKEKVKREGLLKRRERIEALKERVKELLAKKEEVEGSYRGLLSAYKDLQQEYEKLEAEQNGVREKLTALSGSIEALSDQIDRFEEELRLCDGQMKELVEDISSAHAVQGELSRRLKEVEEKKTNLEEALKTLSATLEEKKLALAKKEGDLQGVRNELAHIEAKISSLEDEIENLKSGSMKDAERVEELEEFLQTREEELLKLSSCRERIKEELKLLEEKRASIEAQLVELDGGAATCRKELVTLEEKQNSLRTEEEKLLEELHKLEVEQSGALASLEALEAKFKEKYDISLKDVEVDAEFDPAGATVQVEALKQRLEAMGGVNLEAFEEHRQQEARYEFLKAQYDDLQKARDDLKELIAKINKTARDAFRSTFSRVNEEFGRIFKKLFGGGDAKLLLLEGDILEAGIDIHAQPPGKRMQNISLLSGGEKALTALAFLFALFSVRPSPFCILDEVDASLDDVNIGRFLTLLEDLAGQTQFVIITHNKQTMEFADALFGITMEEPGVSKVISLKLEGGAQIEGARSTLEAAA